MAGTQDETIDELRRVVANLRRERDAALARRESEYAERAGHQAASVEVLRAITASPDDPRPVFELIARLARTLCGAATVAMTEFDGTTMRARVMEGVTPEARSAWFASYPRPPGPETLNGRVTLAGEVLHIRDLEADVDIYRQGRLTGAKSFMGVPLLRDGQVIGTLALSRMETGGFDEAAVRLVQAFAEQAALAIGSAETYRALRTRTADLQESLEYQTATSDVLKVIGRSTFDLQPILDTVVETAARLCHAEMAVLTRSEGDHGWVAANYGFPPAYEDHQRGRGLFPRLPDAVSAGQRAWRERRVVHIHDAAAVPGYPEASLRLANQRTTLAVPLMWNGEPIGILSLARQRVEPFTERQIDLVNTFADQAAIAMENARLITEQREALEQQTATAEVLGVINANPGNLAPVFEAILQNGMRLCDAAFGLLRGYDGEQVRTLATLGVPDTLAEFSSQTTLLPPAGTKMDLALKTGRTEEYLDILESDLYQAGNPGLRAVGDLGGARTLLMVPLVKDRVSIGLLTFYRQEVRGFSTKEVALLESFAAQAVIAMDNARLITEQREALGRQTAMAEVLGVINASPGDTQPVFDTILQKAHDLCDAASGALTLYDGQHTWCVATHGVPEEFAARLRQPFVSTGMSAWDEGQHCIHVPDMRAVDWPEESWVNRGLVQYTQTRTRLVLPMRKDGKVIGVISANRSEVKPFTEAEIGLLENFAAQAVIAMENARLITEQREALEQQTATAEILRVINANPGDPAPVFDVILEKSLTLAESAFGTVWLYVGSNMHTSAARGMTPALAEFRAKNPVLPMSPFARRAAETGRSVQIPDVREGEPYKSGNPGSRAVADLGGARTMLLVPLTKDRESVGVIQIYRQEVRAFTDKQIALLESFAAQAVIAIDNARLITEQREALERQTATADILRVINANPGDTTPVFDAILEKAMHLCGVSYGNFSTWDGMGRHQKASRGFPAAMREYTERRDPASSVSPAVLRFLAARTTYQVPDLMADEGYRDDHPDSRAIVDLGGMRTALFVPLFKDGDIVANATFYRPDVRVFSDKEIALLENFAAQATIAMENARLLTEQREALERQTATSEVLQVINASPGDLPPVFDAMLEKAMRLCSADSGVLWTMDGDLARVGAHKAFSPAMEDFLATPFRPGPNTGIARLAAGEDIVHIADLAEGPGYRAGDPMHRAAVDIDGSHALVAVPLRDKTAFLGAFGMIRRRAGLFSDKQVALLRNFAAQAVIAMDNARLITEQREALERQTATAEVLGVINALPGDLVPVFDAILEKILRLAGSRFGFAQIFDGTAFRMIAWQNLPDALVKYGISAPLIPNPGTSLDRLVRGEDIIQIVDIKDTDAYRSGIPGRVAIADLGGGRTALWVALRKNNLLLGTISVYRTEVQPFTDKQIALIRSFAAQAEIAMESARLLSEQREALEQQTATADILRVINANPGDTTPVFDAILEKSLALAESAFGTVWLYDGSSMHAAATRGMTQALAEFRAENPVQPMSFQSQRVNETGRSSHLLDVRDGPGYRSGFPGSRAVADLGGARTQLVVPLMKDQEGIGNIQIYRQDVRPFTDKQIALLESFAAQAVIAIGNARLIDEIRAARDNAEATLRELKIAQANLVQAEKMASLGQLTAGIAHEIKNPLNFVNNFAVLSVDLLAELQETAAPGFAALTDGQRADIDEVSAMLTSNLRKIEEHGKRADGIVKAMLEHSRGASGERREVDVNALVEEALNLAYHGARARDQGFNIALERDYGADIPALEVNPQDLTRVFLNLFANGFYAAGKRARDGADPDFAPTLRVSTRDVADGVEIRVRDNGTGIAPDIRDKLFQPFFTTKPTGEGTGLGLSITYDIVTKAHGGTIAVDSDVGVFTEFAVTLPRRMFAGVPG